MQDSQAVPNVVSVSKRIVSSEVQPAGEFLTTEELAALVKTTAATCRYWRHINYGPVGFRVGRRVLYRRDEVLDWLDRLRREQVPAA